MQFAKMCRTGERIDTLKRDSDYTMSSIRYIFIIIMVLGLVGSACSAAAALEGPCTADADCTLTTNADKCVDTDNNSVVDKCKCKTGYIANTGNTACVAAAALEGPCTADADCTLTTNADKCVDTDNNSVVDKCKCKTGYIANTGNTACVAAAALEGPCTADADCTLTTNADKCVDTDNNSVVDKCKCKTGYIANTGNTACVAAAALEGPCTADADCTLTTNADKCVDTDNNSVVDKCKCKTGYIANTGNTACVANGALKGTCATNASCNGTTNADVCTTNKCECKHGYSANTAETACIANGALNGVCSAPPDCTRTTNADVCTTSKCACKTGYSANTEGTVCIANGALKGVCAKPADCTGTTNADVCTSLKCECKTGYSANIAETACIVDGALGGKCTVSSDCTSTTNARTCTSAKCMCDTGFSANPTQTECLAGNTGSVSMTSTWILVIAYVPVSIYL
ncbi:G surface protein, allelic form 156-like [Dreissena polymorpha]|uniref:G surface protein, allelic form 156-like n=1 Tax=Dreissena polymorpha TaxID=45954 RepID=UPI00226416C1|nr:G surface protein, allelic form 156-like [Dreissena polymorpha]